MKCANLGEIRNTGFFEMLQTFKVSRIGTLGVGVLVWENHHDKHGIQFGVLESFMVH